MKGKSFALPTSSIAAALAIGTGLLVALPLQAHGPEGHKNLKVLADDHKAIDRGMKAMAKGLGVKCTACHVKGKFDKDDVPAKAAGRKFLTVVVGEPDKVKRSEALRVLLDALKLEKPHDEEKIWEAVGPWKQQSAPAHDALDEGHDHEGHNH